MSNWCRYPAAIRCHFNRWGEYSAYLVLSIAVSSIDYFLCCKISSTHVLPGLNEDTLIEHWVHVGLEWVFATEMLLVHRTCPGVYVLINEILVCCRRELSRFELLNLHLAIAFPRHFTDSVISLCFQCFISHLLLHFSFSSCVFVVLRKSHVLIFEVVSNRMFDSAFTTVGQLNRLATTGHLHARGCYHIERLETSVL